MSQENVPVYADDDPKASIFHDGDNEAFSSSDADILERGRHDTVKVVGPSPTVKMSQETVASPEVQQEESPSSLFTQAYESVRNTDTVSNIVDHVQVWWKGRHIDAIDRDIKRLEGLKAAQDAEAGRHQGRLQASTEHASTLSTIQEKQGLRELPVSHTDTRAGEHQSIQARAESHAIASEKIAAELMRKQELKAQYEKDRDGARGRIAERFQRKIEKNAESIAKIDSAVDEIRKNLEVADTIIHTLQTEQASMREIIAAQDALAADKQAARAFAQELEGRIQDVKSKMHIQEESMRRHTEKRAALDVQKNKWESKIAPKKEPQDPVIEIHTSDEDRERLQGFIDVTQAESGEEQEDDAIDVTHLVEEDKAEEKPVEKDPWVGLLENIQSMMKDPEYQKYDDEAFRNTIEQQGTPEQKLLLQHRDVMNELFRWLNTASGVEKTRREKSQLVDRASDAFADVLDKEDPAFVDQFMTEEGRATIESRGTPEQKFIVKLLDYLSSFFEDIWSTNEKNKKPLL